MQRILTIAGFIILFAIGVATLAGGAAAGRGSYSIPEDPAAVVILLGSILGIVVITLLAGLGLAQIFKILNNQISAKQSPDDRPNVEKRALAMVDKFGSAAGQALSKVGYGASAPVAPYTPSYSYKAAPENAETRQFAIGLGVVLVLLFGYAAFARWETWLREIQSTDQLVWAIGGGSAAATVVLTLLLGAGLAFWFRRTQEEKDKATRQAASAGAPPKPAAK